MIKKYESMIIVEPMISEDDAVKIVAELHNFIKENGGEILKSDKLGKRKLAFEIMKKKEGYYFVNYFTFDNLNIHEIDRFYKLNENIFRYNLLKLDD